MFGLFARPEKRRMIMAPMMVGVECMSHEGHGLLKPPVLTCHALAFVKSSSGRALAIEGTATVAAYTSADVEDE